MWKKTRKEKLSQTMLKIYTIFMRNMGDALSVLLVFCLVINQIKTSSAGPILTLSGMICENKKNAHL